MNGDGNCWYNSVITSIPKTFPEYDQMELRTQIWSKTESLWNKEIEKKVTADIEITDELESMIAFVFEGNSVEEVSEMILTDKAWKNRFNDILNLCLHRFWEVNVLLYNVEQQLNRQIRFIDPKYQTTVHLIFEREHYDATIPMEENNPKCLN